MSLPLLIGLRYTGAKQRNQLVSFLSAISMAGLVVGVSLLILVLSIMNGFELELREKILGVLPHATVYHREGIGDWEGVQESLENTDGIIAAAPFVELQGLAANLDKAQPMAIFGIDLSEELRVSRIADFVDIKALQSLAGRSNGIVIGQAIAKKIGVTVGDELMVIVPSHQGRKSAPKIAYFTVKGLIVSQTEVDESLALTSIESAQSLSKNTTGISGLHLKLEDMFAARRVTWDAVMGLGAGYYGVNWISSHGNLYHAIQTSKNLVALLMLLIVAIAVFNVVSTLVMVVVDKQGDIAILRTLGASSAKIMQIFMVQGVAIGTIGTCVGVLVGVGLSLVIQRAVGLFETIFNTQFLKSDVYPLTYLPTEIIWMDIFQVAGTALGLSFLATIYPAWRASRLNPAEALRYE